MSEVLRRFRLVGATGKIRTAVYNGSEHLVVPVRAMVEGVIWAVNSEYPELVLASELAVSPQQWNGRAAFAGHPEEEGEQVTANTPKTLEKSFGWIFNTASESEILANKALDFEVYIDPVKAEKVGREAQSVVRRLKADEAVEVSVGVFIVAEQIEGVYSDGKPYLGAWREIVSDHIAFLGEDEVGACSIAAGCGAARYNIRHLVSFNNHEVKVVNNDGSVTDRPEEGELPAKITERPKQKPSMLSKVLSFLSQSERVAEGASDVDLRRALDDALRADVPGYNGIGEVFPDDGEVIYYAMPESKWLTFKRKYTFSDGKAELSGEAVKVEPVTRYEEVKAAAAGETQPPCGCGNAAHHPPTEERVSMKKETKTFIDASGGRFKDSDAVWLDNVPADKLADLVPVAAAAPVTPVTPVTPAPAAAPAPTVAAAKEAAFDMKTLPPAVQRTLKRAEMRDAEQKAGLIKRLKTAQTEYTEAELAEMEIEELERIGRLCKVKTVDYSAQGLPRAAEAGDEDEDEDELARFKAPDPYADALEARRAKSAAAAKTN